MIENSENESNPSDLKQSMWIPDQNDVKDVKINSLVYQQRSLSFTTKHSKLKKQKISISLSNHVKNKPCDQSVPNQ